MPQTKEEHRKYMKEYRKLKQYAKFIKKTPHKTENPKTEISFQCSTIQQKLYDGEPLSLSEMSHLSSCKKCSLAYKKYGSHGVEGIESFWKNEEPDKPKRDIQKELNEDFPDLT